MIIDLLITVGIPVCQMGLGKRFFRGLHPNSVHRFPELLVAGHRFTIIEDFGCFPATSNTPLTYVLVWSWPLIIGIISACYGGKFPSRFKHSSETLAPSSHHPLLHQETEAVQGPHHRQHQFDLRPILASHCYDLRRFLPHHPSHRQDHHY